MNMSVARTAPALQKIWLPLGYGAGSFGANVAIFPATSLILYFLTDTVGLSIALATIVISAPKLWDILADPAIGAFADHYARARGNRCTVFALLAATLPLAAAGVFLLPAMSSLVFAILAVVILIIKSTLYTVFLVSHVAAADDIGVSGVAPRNAMLAVRVIGQAAGALVAGAAAPLLLARGPQSANGYPLMALCLAAGGVAGIIACAAALRTVPTQGGEPGTATTDMLSAFRHAAGRPAALGLIASNFGVLVASSYLANTLPYINKYVLHAGDRALSPMFSALMAAMLVGAASSAWLSTRLGDARTFRLAITLLITAALFFYPASGSVYTMVAALVVWGLGIGAYTVLLQSSLLAAAKGEGAVAGLVGLLLGLLFATGKIGDTLGGVLTGATLAGSGGSAMLAAHVGADIGLRTAFGIIPAALVASGFAVMLGLNRRASRATAVS